jgi:hypothetical protein
MTHDSHRHHRRGRGRQPNRPRRDHERLPRQCIPVGPLAGKIVLDTNNYMPIRDGRYPIIDSREKTEHELRLYDQFEFDTVDNSPLSQSCRSGPGQPARNALLHQTHAELTANLAGPDG